MTDTTTYAGAGVDIDAGERAVDLIRPLVAATRRPEVLGGLGGFGGLFAVPVDRYRHPVLVASTDGVGTKLEVARQAARWDTIGLDLVAMCVDDLVCQGAEPAFFLDYIAVGRLDPAHVAAVVAGIAEGCRRAGCALLGGEMAEHPGSMPADGVDVAGFAVGLVERDRILDGSAVRPGDALVGFPSPGLRSNGFSLARAIVDRAGWPLDGPAWPGGERTLADELLEPSVIYAPAVLALLERAEVHGVAHITGGGLPGNVPRMLPEGCRAVLDRATWSRPRIQTVLLEAGRVSDEEGLRVFNQGLGMVLAVADADVDKAVAGGAVVVGEVVAGPRGVELLPRP